MLPYYSRFFVDKRKFRTMTKFVDPRQASSKIVRTQSELDLVDEASSYANQQKSKTVRWFVCHGSKLPTEAESANVSKHRSLTAEQLRRQERENDRQRVDVATLEPVVIVPTVAHPLYSEQEHQIPPFVESAANGLSGRAKLFSAVEQLCRIVMLRNRCDTRLNLLQKKSKSDLQLDVGRESQLTLIEMPQLYSSDVTVGAPPARLIDTSAPTIELYHPKELKTSFVFKNKGYRQQKFSEHQFANADLPTAVPVLFAGSHEVPAESLEGYSVPKVEHFVQPLVTLETFPTVAFAFVTPEPWQHTVQSQLPQRLSNGGFQERHQSFQFGRLAATRTFHSDPVTHEVVRAPIPRTMDRPDKGDTLSDSDDDETLEVDLPTGLDQIKAWVPQIESSRMPLPESHTRHAVDNELCKVRLDALHNQGTHFISELPPELQLSL